MLKKMRQFDELIECLCYIFNRIMFHGIDSIDEQRLSELLGKLSGPSAGFLNDYVDLVLASYIDMPFAIELERIKTTWLRRAETERQLYEHHIISRFAWILRQCDFESMYEMINTFSEGPAFELTEQLAKDLADSDVLKWTHNRKIGREHNGSKKRREKNEEKL